MLDSQTSGLSARAQGVIRQRVIIMALVKLEIEEDEALVLFELLSRFSDSDVLEIVDASEDKSLWSLQCNLEKQLSEPLSSNYQSKLERARENINGDK